MPHTNASYLSRIDDQSYFDHARDLSFEEMGLIREFAAWLPKVIIDCHGHCNLREHAEHIGERAFHHMYSTFPGFDLKQSQEWLDILHPGTVVQSMRFAHAFKGINHKAANDYLLNNNPAQDAVALYGIPDDVEYTNHMLADPRVSALKMYYAYFDPPATQIYQYFPPAILKRAEKLGKPIILHPPRRITDCMDQIEKLVSDFPDLKICLAHMGLNKTVVPGLEEAFEKLAKYPNVYFDTSLVPSAEVIAMGMRIMGPERIMYGADAPLHLVRSVAFTHPESGVVRLATKFPYHWVNPGEHEEFKHLAEGVVHAHWGQLTAIRDAVEALPPAVRQEVKENVFYNNAKRFYKFPDASPVALKPTVDPKQACRL
jgi:hypothetical protein